MKTLVYVQTTSAGGRRFRIEGNRVTIDISDEFRNLFSSVNAARPYNDCRLSTSYVIYQVGRG